MLESIPSLKSPSAKRTTRRRISPSSLEPPQQAAATQALIHQDSLLQRISELQAKLESSQRKADWLQGALTSERQARQLLEARFCNRYQQTIAYIRLLIETTLPLEAIVLIASKGDDELLRFEGKEGWHFP